jgi:S-adenosylmethionine:tRNA ribosyltransferase-isomerase
VKEELTIADLEYDLPQERIATQPVSPRSSAKLLVVRKNSFEDCCMKDFPDLLPENVLLVANETAVLPARFTTVRKDSGGKVEGLFLEEHSQGWCVMLKSNGKLRSGIMLELADGIDLTLIERSGTNWICACSSSRSPQDILVEVGTTPIPPYILRARGEENVPDAVDREQYQTVFAKQEQRKSVAAPTAGLHFDESLLSEISRRGIEQVYVTLHVGAGTFKGIETQEIKNHVMHHERWAVSQQTLDSIGRAKKENRPIIAVGTTTVRTLESLPAMESWPVDGGLSGSTDLMIAPPYEFRFVDGMLTNFHLPKSTLLTLVAAKIGIERLHSAYKKAIASEYRFYSYGDAMFILP